MGKAVDRLLCGECGTEALECVLVCRLNVAVVVAITMIGPKIPTWGMT